jgi:predicted acyltransferase
VVGCIPLLYCLYVAHVAGGLNWLGPVKDLVSVGEAMGSHAAITLAGVALGMMLAPGSTVNGDSSRIRWAFWFAAALLLAGNLLHSAHGIHRMFIYNKNAATPPWCLVSSAITAFVWIAIFWMVDVRKQSRGTQLLALAGQNALLAYILAPVIYAIMQLAHLGFYGALGNSFPSGLLRSIVWTAFLIWLSALLRKRNVQLKL